MEIFRRIIVTGSLEKYFFLNVVITFFLGQIIDNHGVWKEYVAIIIVLLGVYLCKIFKWKQKGCFNTLICILLIIRWMLVVIDMANFIEIITSDKRRIHVNKNGIESIDYTIYFKKKKQLNTRRNIKSAIRYLKRWLEQPTVRLILMR